VLIAARRLLRDGCWDLALGLLPAGSADPAVVGLRAEILVDRFWWQLAGGEEAEAALAAMEARDDLATSAALLGGQLLYTRVLFKLGAAPDDVERAEAAYERASDDPALIGWATFWRGVLADNVRHDLAAAAILYSRSLHHAHENGDLLLESYVVRHQGAHLRGDDPERALLLLRRSLYLRAAIGARPQVAAAQATLAQELPPGDESKMLRELALHTAQELRLTWLLGSLQQTP
jgi:hypothetical protein